MAPTEGATRSLHTPGWSADPANLSGKADSGGSLGAHGYLAPQTIA